LVVITSIKQLDKPEFDNVTLLIGLG